jgi:hypothetical protein
MPISSASRKPGSMLVRSRFDSGEPLSEIRESTARTIGRCSQIAVVNQIAHNHELVRTGGILFVSPENRATLHWSGSFGASCVKALQNRNDS